MAARAASALTAASLSALLLTAPVSLYAAPAVIHIPPGEQTVTINARPVIGGSEIVICAGDTLRHGRDYSFTATYSELVLSRAYADTVYVTYRTIPALESTVRRFAPVSPAPQEGAISAVTAPSSSTFEAGRFQIAGSKKLSLGIGDTDGGLIEQSLFLSIQGELGSGLTVEGTISDRSTATDAITRRVSEFDKLSLRAYGPGFHSEFGDTELEQKRYKLFSLRRRISGLRLEGSHAGLSGQGAMGRRRGEFRTRRFYGEDGKQGPYSLSTGNQVAVVAGSETVWLDGLPMEFGADHDYEIDYPTGMITFTPRRPITRESRITVDYEIAVEAYNSLVYEVGAGSTTGGLDINMLYHREWDDPNHGQAINLLDSDRAALSAAGDSASLAVRSGVDSVGAGNGSYDRDSIYGYFVYVGPSSGSYQITFSYVGPGAGDYRSRGDGGFYYAGTGAGDYAPVIALPLPGQLDLFTVQATQAWQNHRVALEWAQSSRDLNTLSSRDDGDNSGGAFIGNYMFSSPDLPIAGSAYWRHRDARFHAPGRDADVEYDRRWGRVLGQTPGREDEYGSSVTLSRADDRAQLQLSALDRGSDDHTWRSAADIEIGHAGRWHSRAELLRRTADSTVKFETGRLEWQTPLRPVPLLFRLQGERRVQNFGYRYGEAGVRVGPSSLNAELTFRRTDSLTNRWQRQNDLYGATGVWQADQPTWSGRTQVHYEQRHDWNFAAGRQDRLLSESHWVVRARELTLRVDYRLSRSQAATINEEFIPVDPGRGDYRESGGQYISDSLGDLIRIVRTSAFGHLARQSEKHVNAVWQAPNSPIRAEIDLNTTETAADADLPEFVWLLPWQTAGSSPERARTLRSDISGGTPRSRWLLRTEWSRRLNKQTSRPEDFRGLASDFILRLQLDPRWRFQIQAGGGDRLERLRFPYAFRFAKAEVTPALRPTEYVELSLPVFWQRYWNDDNEVLADWQRLGMRAVIGVGTKGRVIVEPSLIRVADFGAALPLEVADGRAVGTSAEWRLQGSLDLSKTLVGRLLYRGRAQSGRPAVHRADLSVEATF